LRCSVDAVDPDGDKVAYYWDLRPDVSGNKAGGGDFEASSAPIAGAVVKTAKNEALIQLPPKEGNYRIFVYVVDGKKSAATANLPIQVK
jgi:hypothetical protein